MSASRRRRRRRGQGGGASYEPALARICENDTITWKTPPPILLCLNPLLNKTCDPDHEEAVRDCLLAPTIVTCNGQQEPEPPAACQALVDKCPGLTLDACSSVLISNDTRGDCITRDYSPATCVDEFLRCAWDF